MQILMGVILSLLGMLALAVLKISSQGHKNSELELENKGLKNDQEIQGLKQTARDNADTFRKLLNRYRNGR